MAESISTLSVHSADTQPGSSTLASDSGSTQTEPQPNPKPRPRVTITYCTQCKWLLRAAYFAQELLSTFGTDLGEVVLRPGMGGVFLVDVDVDADIDGVGAAGKAKEKREQVRIWDRKVEGGFPETKILKRKVRDLIDPARALGHVDRDYHAGSAGKESADASVSVMENAGDVVTGDGGQAEKAGEDVRIRAGSNGVTSRKDDGTQEASPSDAVTGQGGGHLQSVAVERCEDCA